MKNTKQSLIPRVIALVLCFSMLLGSSYAWFTDSAISEGNVIKSGNLNVEMYWSDTLLEASSSAWQDADGVPVFTYDNWEPGYTDVKYIKVKNAGNLSFKWRLSIEAEGAVTDLADVIDVYYINPVSSAVSTLEGKTKAGVLSDVLESKKATEGVLLPEGESSPLYTTGESILAVAFHMQEDAGNTYQGLSIGDGFKLKLIATQFNYESDVFGPDYDKESQWPNEDFKGNSASVSVVPTADSKVSSAVSMTSKDGAITASVPEGVALQNGTNKLTLKVDDVSDSRANITLSATEAALSIDVHIDGVAENNEVVMAIGIKELLPVGLNMGNYRFYHVEDGSTVEMTLLADGATPVHNNYEYDPATGDAVLYLKSFSEVALVADTENAWDGKFDYTWYDASKTELTIANADQLAAFGAIVGGMAEGIERDSFAGKTVNLLADINLGDKESENKENIIFYPIGYWNNEGTYDRKPLEERTTAVESGLYSFCGIFDGNGHIIANFYHNTWEMKGDHNWYDPIKEQYYRDGMGLFGKVYGGTVKNLTVKNFSSDGEIATTGVIAAYADGATFENIAIFNCSPRVYNIGNGGIVGCVGWYANEANLQTTFKNITVDNSNKISALWGSYDVACGGIVGQYYPTSGQSSAGTPANGGISFVNCHISAQMDVYNDVCGNYQYYAYRYAGMLIGSVRENVTINGHVYPKMDGITAQDCTVHFGTWNDYYYCEFEKNGHPSYSGPDDYKFSRVPDSEINFTDSNGNGIIDTLDERMSVTGCKHVHTDAENNRAILLPFNNLVTGYGWGVTTKVVGELEGVTILDREEGNSVVKFAGKVNELVNSTTIKLGDIFNFVDNGVKLVPGALTVTVTNVDENNPVSATIDYDRANWENTTITFSGVGNIKITIQDYYFCTPTELAVNITEPKPEVKFDVVMNNGDFLHRVGNIGTVALDKLFKVKDGVSAGTVSVTVEAVNGTSASGTYSNNAIQFSGTGVVKVTITDNDYCIPTELYLEVVVAVNATGATNATANNVVLLNDCGFSSLEVSGGYTLYGNGFTMTCERDSAALDMGYAFVTLNNGTLDNVQIVCPNFDYAVLYKSNMTESGNRSETTDRTRYFNVKSGVMVSGNSQILNSRISGARAAVNVAGGNCKIDNSRIELGAVASLLVGSANSLTLKDVTLVQKPTASTYDPSKTLMGFSVLFVCDADGNAAPVTIEGTLVQNAWVDENDKQYVPSAGQSIISTVLAKTEYLHDLDGDGTKESLNLGFAYMPESLTSKVNTTTITDNRTNKDAVPYDYAEVAILNGKTYVYSYKNTNGTSDSFKTESEYKPNKQGDIITVTYSDTSDGLESSKSFGTDGWTYELNVDLDKLSGYALDFSKLSMTVNGVSVTDFKVNGNAKPTSPIAVIAGGVTYTLTATIDGKEYTATYKVTGTETSKESPSLVASNYEVGLCVASSYGGTWHGAAPALIGIQIKYWSVAEKQYKTINLSDYTPTTKGQLNGTNTTWTYSPANGDFTLTLTGGQVHSSNNVYAMPVVCDGKLYFVAANSKGLVNSGNSARTIPVSYTFKDNNNGDVLTFSHTWSVAENKDAQYKYSDFCSGTLTKLEKSGGTSPCVTPDTRVTLADGTQKEIQYVTYEDKLLVWDFYEGKYAVVPAAIIFDHGYGDNTVIKLDFSNGASVKVVNMHQFFDATLNNMVTINAESVEQYVGHEFIRQDGDGYSTVTLNAYTITNEYVEAWGVMSALHYNIIVEGIFSADFDPADLGLFNYFEIGENMKYDAEQMQADIEMYGLYTYEDFADYLTYEQFVAFNVQYFKISVEKGNYTFEGILALIDKYLNA